MPTCRVCGAPVRGSTTPFCTAICLAVYTEREQQRAAVSAAPASSLSPRLEQELRELLAGFADEAP
jgi:hypothetical protein